MSDQTTKGVIKIGRSGTKLHPAVRIVKEDGTSYELQLCSCATKSYRGIRGTSKFFPGVAPTCKR